MRGVWLSSFGSFFDCSVRFAEGCMYVCIGRQIDRQMRRLEGRWTYWVDVVVCMYVRIEGSEVASFLSIADEER